MSAALAKGWQGFHDGMPVVKGTAEQNSRARIETPGSSGTDGDGTLAWTDGHDRVLLFIGATGTLAARDLERIQYLVRPDASECADGTGTATVPCTHLTRATHAALRIDGTWWVASTGHEPASGAASACRAGSDCAGGGDVTRWEQADLDVRKAAWWPTAIDPDQHVAPVPTPVAQPLPITGVVTAYGIWIPSATGRHTLRFDEYTVTRVGSANLSIRVQPSAERTAPSGVVTHFVKVTNAGPDEADDVAIALDLSKDVVVAGGGGDGVTCSRSTGAVRCVFPGRTEPGQERRLQLSLRTSAQASCGTDASTRFTVTSRTPDPDPKDNVLLVATRSDCAAPLAGTGCVFPHPAFTDCFVDDGDPQRKLKYILSPKGSFDRYWEFSDPNAGVLTCGTFDVYRDLTSGPATSVTEFSTTRPDLILTGRIKKTPSLRSATATLQLSPTKSILLTDSDTANDPPCCPVITIGPTTLAAGTAGVAYGPVAFSQTGGLMPEVWSLLGTLPEGLTFTPAGVLSGTPTVVGSFPLTFVVTDAAGCTSTQDVTLVVNCPVITVSPGSLSNGIAGVAYGPVSFGQTGGLAPITWSISAGALPAGVTLSATGVLSGTPTVVGTFNVTVKATDKNGCAGTQALSLTVDCPAITVNPVTVGNGTAGVAYAPVTFTQTGGLTPITWSVGTGSLPTGMTLSAAGVLSGTPTVTGVFSFTAKATDKNGCTGVQPITLTIVCPTITVSPTSLSNGTAGVAYPNVTFTQTGGVGAITWSISAGSLPNGVTVSGGGVLSGTPTVVGAFPITVKATDVNGCTGTQALTLTIVCPTVTVSPTSVPNATAGSPYSQTFTQTGGVGTITWSETGALPTGVTLSGAGVLSGTPTVVGAFPITVKATDANGCFGTQALTLTVDCQTIAVSPASLTSGTAGVLYPSVTFTQSGAIGSVTWSATGTLPTGMSFSPAGVLSGTPTTTGSYPITFKVTDANGCTGQRALTLTILCPTIAVLPASLVNGVETIAYGTVSFSQTGGVGSITWSKSGALPSGLTLSAAGVLSGTPAAGSTGSYTVTFIATDQNLCTGQRTITFRVCPNIDPTITPTTLPIALPNQAYGPFQFQQTASAALPISWSSMGTLPTGLTFTSAGVLSGATSSIGSFPVTFIATDANGCTGSVAITVQTCPVITVTSPGTSSGTAGVAFSQTFTQTGATTPTFTLGSGTLPTGVTLSTAGVLSGTPTQTGVYPITVLVTDANGCSGTGPTYTLVISCQTITVSNPGTATGTAGQSFSQSFTQAGGLGATSFSTASTLPAGLTLAANGTLSGTPTVVGTFPIAVKATDSNGCFGTGSTYTLVVSCPTITVTNPGTTTGTANTAFSQTFTQTGAVSGASFTTVSTLPTGLTLSSGGVLSGTPTQTGTFPIVVKVTDGNGCTGTGATYTLIISCQTLTVSPTSVPAGTVNAVYGPVTFTQTNGIGSIAWSETGTLPTGITLSAGGLLSGTPTQSGSFPITVKATDANGCTGTQAVTLVVNCQTITVSPSSLSPGVAGTAYGSVTFTQVGGVGGITWTLAAGSLPTGLGISGAGVLSGTPLQTGTFTPTFRATDSNGCFGERTITLVISCPTITVNPSSLASPTETVAYGPVAFSQSGGLGAITWSRTGALPTGMTFSAAGSLGGTPGAGTSGSYTVTFIATDGNGCTGQRTITFRVCPDIASSITPTTIPVAIPNQAYGPIQFLQTASTATPISWSSTGALPSGITFTSAGVLSGTTSALGSFPVTFIATDTNGCSGSIALTVQTCPTITVTNPGVSTGTAGTAFSQTFTQTGATTPTFSLGSGALPTGLTLSTAGVLSGTPTQTGSFPITVLVTDVNGCTGTGSTYTLVISCQTITVTKPSTATGTAGTSFSQVFTQSGGIGTTTFTTASTLPAGLTLATNGTLSGTPTQVGTFPIVVTATDSNGCTGTSSTYSLVIGCQTITVTNPATTTGTINVAFSQTFTQSSALGGATFTLNTGTLPTGLTLSAAGVLSGTPTQTGSFPITVKVTDGNGCTGVSATYTLVIGCQTITVTNPATTTGTVGTAFSQTFTQSGSVGTATFSTVSTLPTGLTLSTAGILSGTPTQSGTFPIVVKVTDSNGCIGTGATYTLVISCQVITVNLPGTSTGTAGTAFSQTFTQTGAIGSTTFTLASGTLPTGLTLSTGGVLSGTPTQVGSFPITVKVTDSNGCTGTSAAYTLVIACQTITVTNPGVAGGTANTAFSQTFTQASAIGGATFSLNSGTLPTGLTLSAAGVLSGTPTQVGTFPITVKVTDGNGCTGVGATYNLVIVCQVITVSNPATTVGTFNTAFSQTFTASNTIGATTFTLASGTLPTGLALSTAGVLSGTPTQTGTFGITVKATDANGCTGTGTTYTLSIRPNLVGDSYSGVGNTQLFVTGVAGAPSTPAVQSATAALANDTPSGGVTVTAASNVACGGIGGTFTIDTAGRFVYTAPVSTIGTATCVYTGTSDTGATGTPTSATATISITLANRVWYVNGSSAGDGRSQSPTGLVTASTNHAAGDVIFVESAGSPTSTPGAISLKANATLWGQGTALPAIGGITIQSTGATTKPLLTGTVTVSGAAGVTISSLDVSTGASNALVASGALGTFTIQNAVTVTTSTGTGFSLTSATGTVNANTTSFTATSSGTAFSADQGTANLNIGGAITSSTGRSISVTNRTGGTATFSGAVSGTGTGILLNANTGSTNAFTGTISLSTGSNAAFTATAGGTVTATGAGSVITTSTATAVNVTNTNIGAGNLTFQSVTSSGGTSTGIILDTTGSAGGLSITGDSTTAKGGNGSGGTIANKTGADGATATGNGIYLNSTSNVSLRRMQLNTFDNSAIRGFNVNGFTLQYTTINGTSGNASGPVEGAVAFGTILGANGLTGIGLIDNCKVSGAIEHNMEFYNYQAGSYTLTVSNCDIKSNSAAFGGDGIQVEMAAGAADTGTISVTNCFFDDNKSQAVQATALGSSKIDISIDGCTLQRTSQGNEGIILSNGANAAMVAHVTNCIVSGVGGVAIFVGQGPGNATSASSLSAVVSGNTINHPASATNSAIQALMTSTVGQVSTGNILISNNTVTESSTSGVARGILVDTPDTSTTPAFTASVLNNTVHVGDNVAGVNGIAVQSRRGAGCFDVRGNVVDYPNGTPVGVFGLRVRQASPGTAQLEQGVSSGAATIVLAANNTSSTTEVLGTVSVVANNTCQIPPP